MLGFRLNKLGAAMRSGLDLRSLYGGGYYGFLPKLESSDYVRQTYNAPATTAASAGDPIGLWLPSQSPADVTNLLLRTDAFDIAVYTKTRSSITANVAARYDGVPTADKLVEDSTATNNHYTYQLFTISTATTYTWAVDVKAAGRTWIGISAYDGSTHLTFFDLTNGVVGTNGSGNTSSIVSLGSGWYRCIITRTTAATTTGAIEIYLANADNSISYTGDGTSGVYLARTQVNIGSTALDYQPNAGSLGGSNRRTGGSNMLLRTEEVGNATSWSLNNVTATLNDVANSDGNMRGSTIAASASNAYLSQLMAPLAGTYTLSIEAKATAAGDYLGLVIQPQYADRVGARFDLNAGTVVGASIPGGSASVLIGATIESKGNGWYRCTLAATIPYNANCRWYAGSSDSTQSNTDPFGSVTLRTIRVSKAMVNIGSAADTYSRNLDQLGGLLQAATLFQSTSADRGTRARRPASGIRNLLLNNMMTGGSAPSTYPAGWSAISSALGTITATLAYGTDSNGNPCLDVALVGTSSGTGYYGGYFATATTVNAVSSNTVTNSVEMKLQAGALTNVGVLLGIDEQTSAGAYVTGGNNAVTPTSTQTRLSYTRTLSGGGTVAYARPSWLVSWGGAVAVNITLRFVLPQCEKAAAATAIQKVISAADITESGYPDVWHTLWDGTSDYGTFGVQSFGSASLFAAAGQAWTVWGVFRSLDTGSEVFIAKASGGVTRTLQVYMFAGAFTCYVRGTDTNVGIAGLNDGAFHVWSLRWDGTTLSLVVDKNARVTVPVGSSAEEAETITVSARTASAPAGHINGHNDVAMIDRALSDAEMSQLMSNLNATYRAGL